MVSPSTSPATPLVPSEDAVLAQAAAENFPVASRFFPRAVRADLLAIYGFARLTDDIGDEAEGDRLALLDWLEASQLSELRDRCRGLGLQLALAGGIDFDLLPRALEIDPDWIAIRGAACLNGREGDLCPERVARLASIVHVSNCVVLE